MDSDLPQPASASGGAPPALAGLTASTRGLLAEADAAARALGSPATGTGHLLLALLLADDPPARLLAEGLTAGEARAAIAATESRATAVDGEAAPYTAQLRRVAAVACRHAVIYESDDVTSEHLLLAIALNRDCTAHAILTGRDTGAGERLSAALRGDLGGPELASAPPFADDLQASLMLAWSLARAHGYSTIDAGQALAGLRAQDATIGARALATLATNPPAAGDPVLRPAYSRDAYRRIGLEPVVRDALRIAGAQAARLGRPQVASEHLVLGLAAVAEPALSAFLGQRVTIAAVREAVAEAVLDGGAGPAPRPGPRAGAVPAAPAAGAVTPADPGAPPAEFRTRLIALAREPAGAGEGARGDDGSGPGCWPALVAAVRLTDDDGLGELFALLQLQRPDIEALCADVDDLPLTAALDRSELRFGHDVGVAEAIIGVCLTGSPRVGAALYTLGLTETELAAQLSGWRAKRDGGDTPGSTVISVTGLNLLASVLTSLLLLEAVVSSGELWKAAFLGLVWGGHPGMGPFAGAGVAGLLGLLVSPLVGAAHLLGVAVDVVQASMERQAAWSRDGVRMTGRELRCVTRRGLGSRTAHRNQRIRQVLLAAVRGRRPAILAGGGRDG